MTIRWWLSAKRYSFRSGYLPLRPTVACSAIKGDGASCRNAASSYITLPVCSRHEGHLEQVWRRDVEAAAQDLFAAYVRRNRSAESSLPQPKGLSQNGLHKAPVVIGVYFIQARHPKFGELVKIGVSVNVKQRMKDLGHHGFLRFRLLAVERFDVAKEAERREKELHLAFRRSRVRGEWFARTAEVDGYLQALWGLPDHGVSPGVGATR